MWGQEANPVANKSEYIREGYALRKSLKGLKYKKQKKENWMFCKVYKENQKTLEKYTTSIYCLCKSWIRFTTKINKVKLIFLSTIKRSYCPLSTIPLTVLSMILCAMMMAMCCWFRVVTISPFRVLNRCLGCKGWWRAVYSYIFCTTIFFHQVFSMFLSLKANWIIL